MSTIENLAKILRRDADHHSSLGIMAAPAYLRAIADMAEQIKPRYRPPQPSDSGKYCYVEELPDDAPPTLVRSYLPLKWSEQLEAFEVNQKAERVWQFWTVAGWRQLTGGVWPCERPESGGT